MSAERVLLRQIVARWGDGAQVEVWADNTVWISDSEGEHRTPLREWVENDVLLDFPAGCTCNVEADGSRRQMYVGCPVHDQEVGR